MTCCRCPQPAEAWMVFYYHDQLINLFEIPTDPHGGYPMCERHASGLKPPVGWELEDTRIAALTLFPVTPVEPVGHVA